MSVSVASSERSASSKEGVCVPLGWGVVLSDVMSDVVVCWVVCWESEAREKGDSGVMSP